MSYDRPTANRKAKETSLKQLNDDICVVSYGDGSYTVVSSSTLNTKNGRIVRKYFNGIIIWDI